MTGMQTIEKRKISDKVVDDLLTFIKQNRFQTGARLPSERALSLRFGVSRPTVRRGLGSLIAAGFIESKQGAGNFIKRIGAENKFEEELFHLQPQIRNASFEELLELWVAIERTAAELIAERVTSLQLLELIDVVTEMFVCLDEPKKFLKCAAIFHHIFAVASGNYILAALLNKVNRISYNSGAREGYLAADLKRRAQIYFETYQSLRNRDSNETCRLIRKIIHKE